MSYHDNLLYFIFLVILTLIKGVIHAKKTTHRYK